MRLETFHKMRSVMKRLLAIALALFCATSFGATLNPIQLLNPAGSTSGQVIASTGPTTAPAWTTVTLSGLGGLAKASNLSDLASVSTARTNLGLGTAAVVATGTSGATIPLLNSANTWSATQSFGAVTAVGTLTGFTGRLINIRVFSSGGTYTPTTGTAAVYVKVQAGGGAGGGTPLTNASQVAAGSGGTAGAYAEGYYTSSFSGITLTIGAAGAGVSGAAGAAGGTTSFGALLSCPGGGGGNVGSAATSTFVTGAASNTAACTGTALISRVGQQGGQSMVIAGPVSRSGDGGPSVFAGSVLGLWGGGTGLIGLLGSGGSGANAGISTAAQAGATGGAGLIEVFEYSQ